MEHKQIFSVGDLTKRWGVSRAVVLAIIEDKQLPAFAVRKTPKRTTYRVKLADVLAYEEQGATVKANDASLLVEASA